MLKHLVLVAALATAPGAWARTDSAYLQHFMAVEAISGVNARLLWAIAATESSHNPKATNKGHVARTNSYDIGLMQINSRHLPKLRQFGIAEADLMQERTSIEVGAWLLRDLFNRLGPTWEAVGAYNAACVELKGEDCRKARDAYTRKVKRHLINAPEMNTALPVLNEPDSEQTTPHLINSITTIAFN